MNTNSNQKSSRIKQVFIAWVAFQRRSLSMQSHFDYQLKFLPLAFRNRFLRPLEYSLKSFQMAIYTIAKSPDVIWIQLPPNFLLYLAYVYKLIINRKVKIIADSHNATLRNPWIKIPGTVFFLNLCDLVIIHNSSVKQQALDNGIKPEKIYVLEDPPATIQIPGKEQNLFFTSPWIVCPCSFNRDEPIAEIFNAAKLIPEVTVVITGNKDRAKGIHDLDSIPENVKLTGFVSKEEFDCLIANANAVLGLTKLEGIQLSVANEALGAGKPMILANTNTLTNLFYKGAIYVNPLESDSIARGCRLAIKHQQSLTLEIKELCQEKTNNWLQQAQGLQDILNNNK